MDDLPHLLRSAFQKILPALLANPDELRRRLSRLNSKLINSPPRPWCLAIRAADTRLDRYLLNYPRLHATLNTQSPKPPPLHPLASHQLRLTSSDLKRLCSPIFIPRPGLPLRELADLLGVTPSCLLNSRLKGIYKTHYLHNSPGRTRFLLYTDQPLDPSARGFLPPDPLWSITAALCRSSIPKRIRATLTRVPVFFDRTARYNIDPDLHPEHPRLDPVRAYKSKKLPPPPPDFIPYKWKDGQYLGYDWRNPRAKQGYERHQRRLQNARAARKARANSPQSTTAPNTSPPSASLAQGSAEFRGYRFLCPRCHRLVNILFYPLPRQHVLPINLNKLIKRFAPTLHATLNTQHSSLPAFACEKCLHLRRFSRTDPNFFNELVTYLSAGLLFGSEVKLPSPLGSGSRYSGRWKGEGRSVPQTSARKIAYTPRPNRSPSARRPQIERLLLTGLSPRQIADHLHLNKGTILWYAQQIYKRRNVRTLIEFLENFAPDSPVLREHQSTKGKIPEIRRRVLAGESIPQIERELNVSKMMIYNLRQRLRAEGINLPHARAANRIGAPTRIPSRS